MVDSFVPEELFISFNILYYRRYVEWKMSNERNCEYYQFRSSWSSFISTGTIRKDVAGYKRIIRHDVANDSLYTILHDV